MFLRAGKGQREAREKTEDDDELFFISFPDTAASSPSGVSLTECFFPRRRVAPVSTLPLTFTSFSHVSLTIRHLNFQIVRRRVPRHRPPDGRRGRCQGNGKEEAEIDAREDT